MRSRRASLLAARLAFAGRLDLVLLEERTPLREVTLVFALRDVALRLLVRLVVISHSMSTLTKYMSALINMSRRTAHSIESANSEKAKGLVRGRCDLSKEREGKIEEIQSAVEPAHTKWRVLFLVCSVRPPSRSGYCPA